MALMRLSRLAVLIPIFFLISGSLNSSLQADPAKVIWDATRNTSPETVEELKALQEQIKQITTATTRSTVGLLVGMGAGSGVIVSEDGLVLTAAHVIGKPGQRVMVILSDGTRVKAKSLGSNAKVDSGMVRIIDPPPADAKWPGAKDGKWPMVELGKSAQLKKGQWVLSLGHHGGPRQERPPPLRVGRFENYNAGDVTLRSDCTLVGGDSGGPLFDLKGKLVGIHSKIGMFINYNMHVPIDSFQDDWDKLLKSEEIGKATAELGAVLDLEEETPTVSDVTKDSPADKAGMVEGDIITKFNGEKVHTRDDLKDLLLQSKPNDRVVLEVQRDGKTVKLTVRLGRKATKSKD